MRSLITDATSPSLWLQTVLALAAWAAGMALHLQWHPQRRHLSDAWDFLSGRPWIITLMAALILLAQWLGGEQTALRFIEGPLWQWRYVVLPLVAHATESYLQTLHALLPARPLAYGVPPFLTLLAWRIWKWPYRYAARRPLHWEMMLLGLAAFAAWVWLALDTRHVFSSLPEWLEVLRVLLTLLVTGLAMSISQIFLIRLAILWAEPRDPDEQSDALHAIEATLSRWRSVFALAVLNLLWLSWTSGGGGHGSRWLFWEAMAVFAPLPVVVAVVNGPFLAHGALALRLLPRVILPWLGIATTAAAVLMFVHYANALSLDFAGAGSAGWLVLQPVRALVLATVHSWLFLATVFCFLRSGLDLRFPSTGGAD